MSPPPFSADDLSVTRTVKQGHAFLEIIPAAQLIIAVTTHKLLKFQPLEGLGNVVIVTDNNVSGLRPRGQVKLKRELERLGEKVVLVNAVGEMTSKLERWAQS